MNKDHISILKGSFEGISKDELNDIFQKIIVSLKYSLNLDTLYPQFIIKIIYSEVDKSPELSFFDFGIQRDFLRKILTINIKKDLVKLIPIILLRESYYQFIPKNLLQNELVKMVVNKIVENDLKNFDIINLWKSLITKNIDNFEFLSSKFDRLENFIKLEIIDTLDTPVSCFFEYVRKNQLFITTDIEIFFDELFNDFIYRISSSLNHDDRIETFRILTLIFYDIKTNKSLEDYKKIFKNLIKDGKIKTNLSFNKFVTNLQWIEKSSIVSPSYQINWNPLEITIYIANLTFNPCLEKTKVYKIIKDLPFFLAFKYSEGGFAVSVSGYFLLPKVYDNDLKHFLSVLHSETFIIQKELLSYTSYENFLNLNYFREFYKNGRFINPRHIKYDKKYEITFNMPYLKSSNVFKFSIIDFLMLDRMRYTSVSGFNLGKKNESLKKIKTDIRNELIKQKEFMIKIKSYLNIFYYDEKLKNKFLKFIDDYEKFGFFYTLDLLNDILISLKLLSTFISKNRNIKFIDHFINLYSDTTLTYSIEYNTVLNKKFIKTFIHKKMIPMYFKNREQFINVIKQYNTYYHVFKIFYNLKIFKFVLIKTIIQKQDFVKKIYLNEKNKLKQLLKEAKDYKITINSIESKIESFISNKPPIIKPILINTISTSQFAKVYIQISLKYSNHIFKKIEEIKSFFPRVVLANCVEYFSKVRILHLEIFLPNIREKKDLISILHNIFQDDIINIKRLFFSEYLKTFSRVNFYNFVKKKFIYSLDLFKQYLQYIENTFKKRPLYDLSQLNNHTDLQFNNLKDMNKLVEKIRNRKSWEKSEYKLEDLNRLSLLHRNLNHIVLNDKKFKLEKDSNYFKYFVKSVKFIPDFKAFGLSQYYLYIKLTDYNNIDFDFKRLLTPTFQKMRVSFQMMGGTTSFFIKYIFPFKKPNMSYINWLSKSKKIVSEYCIFHVKKIYQVLNFNYNIDSKGWNLDFNRFKSNCQKVLFLKEVHNSNIEIKEFNMNKTNIKKKFPPNSQEFMNFLKIYDVASKDLKSLLSRNSIINTEIVKDLIKKNLIFPFLSLKNLNILNVFQIILPIIERKKNKKIIEIFSYFNLIHIYEIEGEFYIHSLSKKIKFENGFYIKLYLPDILIDKYQKLFRSIFSYLGIEYYLILTDLINGDEILKKLYNKKELKNHNPIKNLIWNTKEKRFYNRKLFKKGFIPVSHILGRDKIEIK